MAILSTASAKANQGIERGIELCVNNYRLLQLVALVSLFDIVTTIIGLSFPRIHEGNVFAQELILSFGYIALPIIKIILCLVILTLLVFIPYPKEFREKLYKISVGILVLVWGGAGIVNIIRILTVSSII